MKIRLLIGSTMTVALLGLGILVGSTIGAGGASAQTSSGTPSTAQTAPAAPGNTAKAAITQQQAEQAALAASPGNTVDHTRLANEAAGSDHGGRGPRGGDPTNHP